MRDLEGIVCKRKDAAVFSFRTVAEGAESELHATPLSRNGQAAPIRPFRPNKCVFLGSLFMLCHEFVDATSREVEFSRCGIQT
jgi:hypothetical protein